MMKYATEDIGQTFMQAIYSMQFHILLFYDLFNEAD